LRTRRSLLLAALPLLLAACAEPENVPGFDSFADPEWSPEDPAAAGVEVDSTELTPPALPAGSLEVAEPVAESSAPVSGSDGEPAAAGGEPTEVGGDEVREDLPATVAVANPEVSETPVPEAEALPEFERGEYTGPFERPEHIRGIYLNAWAAGSPRRRAALIALADTTEINTFVIDIKDATGFISHPTEIPLADSVGATGEVRIRDLPGVLAELEEAGIYPIARIVIVKDPKLIAGRPDLAIQDTAGGAWVDSKDFVWLNPFSQGVWDYHIALAREVAEMGFPEIQWDYVRFPDAPRSDLDRAVFPGQDGRRKRDAIREGLAYARAELADLGVYVTADVFGVTTSTTRDVGIGQVWESFIDQVDAALPMVYPSHYWKGSFGFDAPNGAPYEIIARALSDALEQSEEIEGAGKTIPWLQDFTLGPPRYEAPEVRAQIQATYDVGIQDWILWNPGSRYTEDALEPADGWPEGVEPLMRLAGEIVPVSQRFEILERNRRLAEAEQDRADSAAAAQRAVADSMVAPADTVGGSR
jgi:hypothetical protein